MPQPPPPPPGFQLVDEPQLPPAGTPSLPPGFTFDEAAAAREAQAQERNRSRLGTAVGPRPGFEAIPGQGLPGSPGYRAPMELPRPLPAKDANFGAALKTNLVEDEQTKLRLIAEQLFPGDPNGIKRVGLVEGRPVFVNDDGKLQFVSSTLSRGSAGAIANAPEFVAGTVGSFASSPVIGATAGVAGVRGLKRAAAGLIFDEPQTISGNLADLGKEAAVTAVGGLAGKGLQRLADRGRIVDFTPADLTRAEATRQQIKLRTGIDLDLAQASGDRKLLALRDYASRYPGHTADLLEAQDDIAQGQFQKATDRVLNMVAKSAPAEIQGGDAMGAAQFTLKAARQRVQEAVKPYYDAAYASKTEITNPQMLRLAELDEIGGAIREARRIINLRAGRVAVTDEDPLSLEMLDYAKQSLDDEVERLAAKGKTNKAAALADARDKMKSFLDNVSKGNIRTVDPAASPDRVISLYKAARAKYAESYEQFVTPLENSPIGVLANMHPRNSQLAARVLSDPGVTPYQIAVLKGGLSKSNPDAYRGLVRLWLTKKWDEAQQITQAGDTINPAGKFLQSIMRTPQQRDNVRAMLPADAADALDDLMAAAEKLAKTPLGTSRVSGSNTARDQQITEMLKGRALASLRWLMYPRQSLKEAAEQQVLETGITDLTEALIDPAKRGQLRQIARMPPSQRQLILLGTVVGGQAMKVGTQDTDENVTPEIMREGGY